MPKKKRTLPEESLPPATSETQSCKACGRLGHTRRSSRLCAEHIASRPGKLRRGDASVEGLEKHSCVYKQGLRTLLRPCRESAEFEQTIWTVVRSLSQAGFEASRLLQLHLQCLFEAGEDIPQLNETFIRQFFSLVLGTKAPEGVDDRLRHTFCNLFRPLRGASDPPPPRPNVFRAPDSVSPTW
jgi:hypothetical protein